MPRKFPYMFLNRKTSNISEEPTEKKRKKPNVEPACEDIHSGGGASCVTQPKEATCCGLGWVEFPARYPPGKLRWKRWLLVQKLSTYE